MKSTRLKSWIMGALVGISVTTSFDTALAPVIVLAQTETAPAQNGQLTYDQYMAAGYVATSSRDYALALENFRAALEVRPDDVYALKAIANVEQYRNIQGADAASNSDNGQSLSDPMGQIGPWQIVGIMGFFFLGSGVLLVAWGLIRILTNPKKADSWPRELPENNQGDLKVQSLAEPTFERAIQTRLTPAQPDPKNAESTSVAQEVETVSTQENVKSHSAQSSDPAAFTEALAELANDLANEPVIPSEEILLPPDPVLLPETITSDESEITEPAVISDSFQISPEIEELNSEIPVSLEISDEPEVREVSAQDVGALALRESSGELAASRLDPEEERQQHLLRSLQSFKPAERRQAIWELAQKADSRAIAPLTNLMMIADSQERGLILTALAEIGSRSLQPINQALLIALQDDNSQVRQNAIRDLTLVYEQVGQAEKLLRLATADQDPDVQQTARWALEQIGHPPALDPDRTAEESD
ncbi:MAG: HEAT repeat domain-containing protein [Cyanobacteria bacterium P01_H01_bin.15]